MGPRLLPALLPTASEALGKESPCSWSHCSFQNPFLGLAGDKRNLEISGGKERPQRWE